MSNDRRRTHLDLFSGIGGFALASAWAGFETVGFCEQDKFCQQVLQRHWPHVPIIDDIQTCGGADFGPIDLVTGGFPCQPFSTAGLRRGEEDDRALWSEMAHVIQEARPTWILGENVAGLLSMGIESVLADLEGMGFAVQTFCVPACGKGAPHRRERVWIVAFAQDNRREGGEDSGRDRQEDQQEQSQADLWSQPVGHGADVSHSDRRRCQEQRKLKSVQKDQQRQAACFEPKRGSGETGSEFESRGGGTESDMGLLAHGLSAQLVHPFDTEPEGVPRVTGTMKDRVKMLKGLGNAIVPAVAYEFLRLMK